MADSDAVREAKERAAAAKARAAAARLSEEEAELARAYEEEEAALAEERAATAARRRNELKAREAAARKVGAAADPPYLVRGVDLMDHLPPEADLDTIPNRGLFVVRSPSREAVRAMTAHVGDSSKPQDEWVADLVCASTVDPSPDGASGIKLRQFTDDERYLGAVTMLGNEITDLNGTKLRASKRGR